MKCRCAATAKRRVRFLGARAKFNPVILQQAEGFKCQPTVAPHQLFTTHLPLNTNRGKAATRTYSILPQTRSRRRTWRQHTAEQFQGSRNLCYLWDRWPLWSFSRPILTSFLTSASMKEETTTSPLAYLGHTTKATTRIGTPWWACAGVCLEALESEWQGQKTKPLLPACHLILSHTAQVSAYPGPASCAKGRR